MPSEKVAQQSQSNAVPADSNVNQQTFRAPAITVPKGGGAIRGMGEKFSANPVTGTGSMSVPIAISPGRSGFGPQVSLSYDSGAANGPFGFGWSLGIPSITRKTDKGNPKYLDDIDSDVFILSGAEDLVPVYSSQKQRFKDKSSHPGYIIHRYRPRTEGLFARIERWTQPNGDVHWRSISKDNILTLYGKDPDSRIVDPDDPQRIFSWLISETRDDKGNAIIYDYKREDGAGVNLSQLNERNRWERDSLKCTSNRYIKHIRYGNRISLLDNLGHRPDFVTPDALEAADWMFELVFDYGEHDTNTPKPNENTENEKSTGHKNVWTCRKDPFSSYRAGFEVRTYRLCQRILMFHHFQEELEDIDYLVRSTDLTYVENSVASFITSITQSGYTRTNKTKPYLKKSLPPLEFVYSQMPDAKALAKQCIQDIDSESMENLPIGLDGTTYQWIDLDSESTYGIFCKQAETWYYKRNISANNFIPESKRIVARFGPTEVIANKPLTAFANGSRLLDVSENGQLDLVQMEGDIHGFYERTTEATWAPFRPFTSWPNLNFSDPNLRLADLNGDNYADILITEGDAIAWYPSLAEHGFGSALRVTVPIDEELGPRVVFNDGTQSVYLADLSGDGLIDLVRIRNGEVCYWPNLGYGRFGSKVTMDNSPWFDTPDQFDQARIRLVDTDGSGTTDILYLHREGVHVYFNQSGNSWSDLFTLSQFPRIDNITSVQALDLLSNGTACLVWSSALPSDNRQSMRYITLMEEKPHLLVGIRNNLGAETKIHYSPSTKFYLDDKQNGKPWITRLPFPMHVVERVETFDYISGNHFVTHYTYHHGYFDGKEREFRGFGLVEQLDTEYIGTNIKSGTLSNSDSTNWDPAAFVPPVRTLTWFHTGAYLQGSRISKQFEREYYHEGDPSLGMENLTDDQLRAMELPDTVLPTTILLPEGTRVTTTLTVDEEREACRALKGSILRQEVYAVDGTEKEDRPYTVSERNYTVELLQPKNGNHHAVFFVHPRETVEFHYERMLYNTGARMLADPRVSHTMTLDVDNFGNVLKSAAVGYGRRIDDPDPTITSNDQGEQKRLRVTYTENEYTEAIQQSNDYRTPLIAESRSYEILNIAPDSNLPDITNLFRFGEMVTKLQMASNGSHEIPYEDIDAHGVTDDQPWRRLIERVRTLYRRNDLAALLPFKKLNSMALPGESFKLAFTSGLVLSIYKRKRADGSIEDLLPDCTSVLGQRAAEGGGYVDLDSDDNWWIPSGRIYYSPNSNDNSAAEFAYALQHFFLPVRYRDPFHTDQLPTETTVSYDSYNLLVQETCDALGNRVSAGERNAAGDLATSGIDYRVLQPKLVTDPNGNRSAVAFDALGMVVGTAVMGKNPIWGYAQQGDLLDEQFDIVLNPKQMSDFLDEPHKQAVDLLGTATTRIIYDLDCFRTSGQPVFAATIIRETHVSDLGTSKKKTKVQLSFSYSDGFGREIQKKIQAESGEVEVEDNLGNITLVDTTPNLRWVGSGWTIFNNKGKPVRQYEPFFSTHHHFQFGKKVGVSPILFYDPVERVIATLHPNRTFEKIVFDPWHQTTWDVNDTVRLDPHTDPDVSAYMATYLDTQPGWETWLQERIPDPQNLPLDTYGRNPEQDAALRTLAHADTPAVAFFDSLGRTFLTVDDNGPDQNATPQKFCTRIRFDIEGNQREVIDAKGRIVMRYDYDMLGNRVHQASMEAGERWMLNDVSGKPFYAWDSRGHQFRTTYDQLRRPTGSYLLQGNDPELLIGRTVYGESQSNSEAKNLYGKVYQVSDQAGIVTSDEYDFKGNLLSSRRQLAVEYKSTLDWSKTVAMEAEIFSSSTTYDALNRPVTLTTPHTPAIKPSVIHPAYNAANLLEKIGANLRGDSKITSFVTNIDYNEKGQRTKIEYGIVDGEGNSRVKTEYQYDLKTFRLTQILTTRNANDRLQSLSYFYDPAGNITHIRDDAQQTIYFDNKRVEPSSNYLYDAMYRLIEARGREHLGQTNGQNNPPTPPDAFNNFHTGLPHPGDGNAMGTYIEQYVYDAVGNFLSMQHRGSDPSNTGWARTYTYSEPSQVETGKKNNRLSSTRIGQLTENYRYDGNEGLHGNMTSMPHLPLMRWDYRDQLQATAQQVINGGIPETTWYVYDGSGQRTRKVTETAVSANDFSAGKKPIRKKERIYLGGFEIYREYNDTGGGKSLERETLHIIDDKHLVALVETKTYESGFLNSLKQLFTGPENLIRYQFDNHLGSVYLELNEVAGVISYEEFYPYGSTSYQAVNKDIKAATKRYRYTGKERDEENRLYYHGARYYAPWLGRWTSCDPGGVIDGTNLYQYARLKPVNLSDRSGLQAGPESRVLGQIEWNKTKAEKTKSQSPLVISVTLSEQDLNLLEDARSRYIQAMKTHNFEQAAKIKKDEEKILSTMFGEIEIAQFKWNPPRDNFSRQIDEIKTSMSIIGHMLLVYYDTANRLTLPAQLIYPLASLESLTARTVSRLEASSLAEKELAASSIEKGAGESATSTFSELAGQQEANSAMGVRMNLFRQGELEVPGISGKIGLSTGKGGPSSYMGEALTSYLSEGQTRTLTSLEIVLTHIEGKAAAAMRLLNVNEATVYVYVKNARCSYCRTWLKYLVPEGQTLNVIFSGRAPEIVKGVRYIAP